MLYLDQRSRYNIQLCNLQLCIVDGTVVPNAKLLDDLYLAAVKFPAHH